MFTRSAPIWPFHFSTTGRVAFTKASRSAGLNCVTVTPWLAISFSSGAGFDVEAFDLFDEGRALHVEELGGLHFVACGLVEGLEQQL